MSKRKTQSIRVHSVQWWSAKVTGAKLKCTIEELFRRVASRDKDAWDTWCDMDEECRAKEGVVD